MSKLNEDIIIRYLENRCSEEDFVLINEWMKESDENAGELFRMEEIYQLGKFPFEEENLVVRAERRLGRRLKRENQKKQEVFKLRSVLRYARESRRLRRLTVMFVLNHGICLGMIHRL